MTSASAAKPCTSTCGKTDHATPLNPVRHRARKPAGTARCQRRTDTALHVQRNRPVGDPSASRRRESIGLRCAALLLAIPRTFLGVDEPPFPPLLRMVAAQLKMPVESWSEYGQREQTRREHLVELQTVLGSSPSPCATIRAYIDRPSRQTDKIVLASAVVCGGRALSCPP